MPSLCVVVMSAVFGVFAGRLLQLGLFLHFLRARLRSSANPRLCRSPLLAQAVPGALSPLQQMENLPGRHRSFPPPRSSEPQLLLLWIPYHVISIHNCILLIKMRCLANAKEKNSCSCPRSPLVSSTFKMEIHPSSSRQIVRFPLPSLSSDLSL